MSLKLVNVALVEACFDEKLDGVNKMLASSEHHFSLDFLLGYKQAVLDIQKIMTDVGLIIPYDMQDEHL